MAQQRTPEDVLRAAVDLSRSVVQSDSAFAATPEGDAMRLSISTGARDPRFHQVRIAPGRGLGGQVLEQRRPMRVDDYADDPRITRDFVDLVSGGEGLHGIMCVPVRGTQGTPAALLYAARHAVGGLGDRAVDAMADIATLAEIGLHAARQRARDLELERLRYRQRLAAELHDSIGQDLFVIGVSAQRLLRHHAAEPGVPGDELRQIEAAAVKARQALRQTLRQLSAADEGLAFDARLDGSLQVFEAQTGCETSVVRRGESAPLAHEIEDLLLDVTLEGLRNAVKYQGARFALVVLDRRPPEVRLTVQAERPPAAPDVPTGLSTGYGLQLLAQRARQLRGRLELDTAAPEGPTLRLRLPVPVGAEPERACVP
jgi:signal transduction histidine kinase